MAPPPLRRRFYNSLQERKRLLGRIAEPFLSLRVQRRDIEPNILKGLPLRFVEEYLQANSPIWARWKVKSIFRVIALHKLSGNRPSIRMRLVAFVVVSKVWARMGTSQVSCRIAPARIVDVSILGFHVLPIERLKEPVPRRLLRFRVEEDRIGYRPEADARIVVR